MKLKWYVPAYADYIAFVQGTYPTSYLMLMYLKRARETMVASLFKNKGELKSLYKPAGENTYVMLT